MRIAIISDIHSNLEALEKTFEVIEEHNVQEIICLGDIIGYGANPNECLSLVKARCQHVLLGNHDEAVFRTSNVYQFNKNARSAIVWTSRQLNTESINYLKSLPVTLVNHNAFFTHASPYMPQEWHYIITAEDALANLSFFSQDICFIGHSHVPAIFYGDKQVSNVEKGKRYIINVGSVGQPRDNDRRLCFGLFDTENFTFQHVRAEYNVKAAMEKILNAGLPEVLAERLAIGK